MLSKVRIRFEAGAHKAHFVQISASRVILSCSFLLLLIHSTKLSLLGAVIFHVQHVSLTLSALSSFLDYNKGDGLANAQHIDLEK